ncbi:MAG: hypothetical protein GY757_38315 [bacterium]|nr:hypothetical protein [bacterium]
MKKLFCIGLLVILAFVGCEDSGFDDSDSSSNGDLISKMEAMEERIAELENTLRNVTREPDTDGYDSITFSGVNVRIVSGSGSTDGAVSGLGNFVVGYNEMRVIDSSPYTYDTNHREGSHNIIVGSRNNYSFFGGLVVGDYNAVSGKYSSVSGGFNHTASGDYSSVSGGYSNTASGRFSRVSGGHGGTASGDHSSVSGGYCNTTVGAVSSVSGGSSNTASGEHSSVSGGQGRSTPGDFNWAGGSLLQTK